MADKLNKLALTFTARTAPKNGPRSSDAWNDSFAELASDLAVITKEHAKLVDVLGTLPRGVLDTSVNAIKGGLDGRTFWLDSSLTTASTDLTYFDSTKERPLTVKEAIVALRQKVDDDIAAVQLTISSSAAALTAAEKTAIGSNIFDSTATSTSTSLDGKSENNRLNLLQVAKDVYGTNFSLDNDGEANQTNSLAAAIDALLELHNGNWDDDIALNHDAITGILQSSVNASATRDDAYAGSPTNLEDDLNEIRTVINSLGGIGSWTGSLPELWTGGAATLYDLWTGTGGNAVGGKTASNPWAYEAFDIENNQDYWVAIGNYTGQDSHTDETPPYSSNNFVTADASLVVAISELDSQLGYINTVTSGTRIADIETAIDNLQSFVGSGGDEDVTPSYSGVNVTDGMNVEHAIHELDEFVDTFHSNYVTTSGEHDARLDAIHSFLGQASETDSTPTYAVHGGPTYTTEGISIVEAVNDIERAVVASGLQARRFKMTRAHFKDDFVGAALSSKWTTAVAGSNSAINAAPVPGGENPLGGIVILQAGENDTEQALMGTEHLAWDMKQNLVFETRFRLREGADLKFISGYANDDTGDQCWVGFDSATDASNFIGYTQSGFSAADVVALAAVDTEWHSYKITTEEHKATFFLDDVEIGSQTTGTNLPASGMRLYSTLITNGNTIVHQAALDYMQSEGDRLEVAI